MSRLKNYYTHLITNRRHAIDSWLVDYRLFTGEVAKVRAALLSGSSLQDPATYSTTIFAKEDRPYESFSRRLLYQMANGISSRGQSVMSEKDFPKFIQNGNFTGALEKLISKPEEASHFGAFRDAWLAMDSGNRPVLINRTLAACTTAVSTTVDEGKFGSVYWWLVREELITPPPTEATDWRSRNLHLMADLHAHFENEIAAGETDTHLLSMFVWEMFANLSNPFSLKKQVVRHGAPGTGKTYKARQDAELQFRIWKAEYEPDSARDPSENIHTVQFHPSFGYEDFIEGLRPEVVDGAAQLRLKNGIFKTLCIEAGRWEKDVASLISRELAGRWERLTVADLAPHRDKLTEDCWQGIFEHDGKQKIAEVVPPYFIIIDEINRAELSRVLGELMYCLEYRGVKGAIQTQYSGLNDEETGMLKSGSSYQFFIPHNVFVIGTMNNIDRSVESFDFALRRRFRWEEAKPDLWVLEYHLKQEKKNHWLDLVVNLKALNKKISHEPLLGSDYQVGHAYLMNLNYAAQLTITQVRDNVWEDFIKPLLEEYLRGSGKTDELLPHFATSFGIR